MDDIKIFFERIDTKLDKIYDKLDVHTEHLANVDVTLAKQEKEISVHIEGVQTLKKLLDNEVEERQNSILPLRQHVDFVKNSWKLITMIGALIAIAASLEKLFHFGLH